MQQFLNILREFESYGGRGIVYGGCLRDTVVGVGPIKDIDIAVANTPENDNAITAFVARREDTDEFNQFIGGYGNFPDVDRSVQVTRPDDLLVNFIVLGTDFPCTLEDVAKRCDFGICQIAMDSSGEVLKTAEFHHDLRRYTFTYTRSPFDEAQFARSMRRYERLTAEKFDGWLLRVPEAPDLGTYREGRPLYLQQQQFQNVPYA